MNTNRLFEITLRVHRSQATDLHPRFGGAQIMAEGHDLIDEASRIRELLPTDWDHYVNEFWPGLRDQLPSQQEIVSSMENLRLFFGSFYPFE